MNNFINRAVIRDRAMELLKGKFWYIIGSFFLVYLVQVAFSVLGGFIADESFILSIAISIINLYVSAAFTIGLFRLIFELDDGKEFNITNLFLYFTRFKECLIPALIELIFVLVCVILYVIFAMIFLAGDIYSLMYAYPYVSDNMLYSVLASMMPKMFLFIIVLGIIFSFLNVIPLSGYAICAKGDKRLLNNLFSNAFKIGLNNIKDYILMLLFYFVLALGIIILYFIFSMILGFIASILWPVGIILFLALFFGAFVFFVWSEMSFALLCKKFIEKEIEFRYEQFNNFNGYYTNTTSAEGYKNKDDIIDVSQGVQDTNNNYESSNNSMGNINQSNSSDIGSTEDRFKSNIDVDNKSDFVSVDTWVKGEESDKDNNKIDLSSEQGEIDIEQLKRLKDKNNE